MKATGCILLALVACGPAPAPRAPGPIGGSAADAAATPTFTIAVAAPAVDDLARWTQHKHIDLTYEDGAPPHQLAIDQDFVCELQTLTVDGGRPARVGVTYPSQQTLTVVDGAPAIRTADVEGQTYVLERIGAGALHGAHVDGSPISAAEGEVIKAHHLQLGRPSAMLPLVASRGWALDVDVALSPADLDTYFNDPLEPGRTRSTTVRLVRATDAELEFKVDGEIAVPTDDGGLMTWHGTVTLARDGALVTSTGTARGHAAMRGRKATVVLTQDERLERQPAAAP